MATRNNNKHTEVSDDLTDEEIQTLLDQLRKRREAIDSKYAAQAKNKENNNG